ncbi:hypothetical protein CHS0354_023517 [Potamilus streckersoni]|uniref:Uncharacterized protein n=1 Tax=Potamilus streckersoni TaxID=2493646 RepID=A0AAE0RVI9_9BIVA|nr:hypothetical protein CHS0354_023517 [Potamilus streckersoni]
MTCAKDDVNKNKPGPVLKTTKRTNNIKKALRETALINESLPAFTEKTRQPAESEMLVKLPTMNKGVSTERGTELWESLSEKNLHIRDLGGFYSLPRKPKLGSGIKLLNSGVIPPPSGMDIDCVSLDPKGVHEPMNRLETHVGEVDYFFRSKTFKVIKKENYCLPTKVWMQ